jgi:putative transcription factor
MSCEMCGQFAGPDLVEVEIDGVQMFVCLKCAKFGKKVGTQTQKTKRDSSESEVTFVKDKPGGKGPSRSHVRVGKKSYSKKRSQSRRRSGYLQSDLVLVEDYGQMIKEARKANGYSLEDFGNILNEKVSLLQKIEKSEFRPTEDLIIKIERKLNISLREEAASPILSPTSSKKELTLGDVIKLKKKKKS